MTRSVSAGTANGTNGVYLLNLATSALSAIGNTDTGINTAVAILQIPLSKLDSLFRA